ncbi:MAG: hypothetical protein QOH59_1230 [Gemmatimonadales bacterium]|nr:hypothetical protein [Gemmatimonadales bacterium]
MQHHRLGGRIDHSEVDVKLPACGPAEIPAELRAGAASFTLSPIIFFQDLTSYVKKMVRARRLP